MISFLEDNAESKAPRAESIPVQSRLMTALHRFTGTLATDVRNPLKAKYGEAYNYLISGDTCRYREEVDTAIAHYKQALTHRPDYLDAQLGLAKCYRRKGAILEAIQSLETALVMNAFHEETHLQLAKTYAEAGYTQKAIRHYQRVVKLNPRQVEARFGQALLLENLQNLTGSIQLYEEILEIEPDFLPAYNNMGSLYLRMNQLKEAECLFTQLVAKAPDFARGYLGLAMTLDKAGYSNQAVKAYERVLQLSGNSKNAAFVSQRMIELHRELGHTRTRGCVTLVRVK